LNFPKYLFAIQEFSREEKLEDVGVTAGPSKCIVSHSQTRIIKFHSQALQIIKQISIAFKDEMAVLCLIFHM